MLNLFKFILDSNLQLKHLVSVIRVLDLLAHLGCVSIQSSLEEGLSVVHFVGVNVRKEFGQLIVAVGSVTVVLNLEVREAQQ